MHGRDDKEGMRGMGAYPDDSVEPPNRGSCERGVGGRCWKMPRSVTLAIEIRRAGASLWESVCVPAQPPCLDLFSSLPPAPHSSGYLFYSGSPHSFTLGGATATSNTTAATTAPIGSTTIASLAPSTTATATT